MGGIFGRRKKTQFDPFLSPYNDPFYQGVPPGGYGMPPSGYPAPPPYPYGTGYDPYGGYGEYDPYDVYGYGPTESFESYYGGPMRPGRYGRGFNQMSSMSPWNYGNYYMGNTTLQMMPYMQRKVAKYAQRQAMGSMGGFGGSMPMMPMMPMMPVMPCLPASCSLPVASPMIAAATPLPMACNPLVQNMYPMASMNPFNWMSPSSFMSALTTGPLPYRPPASFEFPSNIGMVMPLPYGTPNPLLTPSCFGGFNPQYNFGGGLSCCCCYCTPSVAPPAISFCPRPVSVPQPCPVPYPVPVPIPNIQQVPIPRPVTVVAPPIVAGDNQALSLPAGAPLFSSQGGFTQGNFGQTLVMASDRNSTIETLLKDETSPNPKRQTSVRKSIDQSRRAKAQKIASSLSNLGLNNHFHTEISSPKSKHRNKSNQISISNIKYTSNLDYLTSDTLSSIKRHGKSTHHHRNSDHHCVVCKQKRLDKFS